MWLRWRCRLLAGRIWEHRHGDLGFSKQIRKTLYALWMSRRHGLSR